MKQFFLIFMSFSILGVAACGNVAGLNLSNYPDPMASRDEFIMCHGYGCTSRSLTNFSTAEWKQVRKIFKKKSATPASEREKIGRAIALMEKYQGVLVGTQDDLPKAPISRKSHKELDCIDETVNTTKYLTFLYDDKLLTFHDVGRPVYKGLFLNGVYPHNSASVVEKETGQIYVIDSYIYKNGEKPVIRSLENWRKYKTFDESSKTVEPQYTYLNHS